MKNSGLIEESPWKGLLKFSGPVFVGLLLQQLYNTVDTIVVGNFESQDALSAVGSAAAAALFVRVVTTYTLCAFPFMGHRIIWRNTAKLVDAFMKGAEGSGNQVLRFDLDAMNIHSCKGCLHANKDSKSPCSQKDDMEQIYAELECLGYGGFPKKSVLLMTAGGSDYSQAVTWYRTYERNLGWKNLGEVLGAGKTREAYQLGNLI